MARKEKVFTATFGRDAGKKFQISEMSAYQAESWASRAVIAILNTGNQVDFDGITQLDPQYGMLGMVGKAYNMLTGIKPETALPLWNELMSCVRFIPSGGEPRDLLSTGDVEDIEEPVTIMQLKKEVFKLHTDFLSSVAGLMSPKQENQSQES